MSLSILHPRSPSHPTFPKPGSYECMLVELCTWSPGQGQSLVPLVAVLVIGAIR